MKVEAKKVTVAGFKPFELIITVENQEEATGLFMMLNYSPLCDFMRDNFNFNCCAIRSKIDKNTPNLRYTHLWAEFLDALKCRKRS